MAPGTDRSLALFPEDAFERWGERLGRASPAQQDVRAFTRLFYAQVHRVELDQQGRIRIPPALAQLAQLERDVVLLGVRDHLELWAAGRWETYLSEKQGQFDQLAEIALSNLAGNRPADH